MEEEEKERKIKEEREEERRRNLGFGPSWLESNAEALKNLVI